MYTDKVYVHVVYCCVIFSLCRLVIRATAKTITNQLKHRDVKFCDDIQVSRLVNTPFFRQLGEIDEDTYEVQSAKKRINLNLPIQVGFFVYQYAKLRMLEFYFDFLDKYLARADFQYCEMDTDSAYI